MEFTDENEVDIVSDAWMVQPNLCHWPPFHSGVRIAQAVKEHSTPDDSWPKFPCRILYTAGKDISKMIIRFDNIVCGVHVDILYLSSKS